MHPLPGVSTPPALANVTALVVDDSAAMRTQLLSALTPLGVTSVEAHDGADAWRKLASGPVDIIITDINMPVMDGLKLIALVRAGGPHQQTPVVVVSAEQGDGDRDRAFRLGANDYLAKPVHAQQVVDVITELLAAE